jgi:signal transduction histidine kinase
MNGRKQAVTLCMTVCVSKLNAMIPKSIFRLIKAKKSWFLIFLMIFFQQSFAQPNRIIDSLMTALKITVEDSSRIRILNALGTSLIRTAQYDQAFKYANEALALAQKRNFKKGMAAAYNTIGSINSNQGNYSVAMENFQTSLTIRKEIKDTTGIAATYSEIGEVYSRTGNYPDAMNNILISLRLAEKIDDKKRIARCYEQLGIILSRQKKFSEALKDHLEALRIRERIKDRPGIAASSTNVGLIYGMLDNDKEALNNHFIALKIREETGEKSEIAVCHQNIGLIYAKQEKLSEALENFSISLKINKDIRDRRSTAFCLANIGKIFLKLNQPVEARQYLVEGLAISKDIGNKEHAKDIYYSLSKLDSAAENNQQALTYYKLYTDYKDSLLNETSNKQIAQLKEQYESEKKDREILQLTSDTQRLQSEKKITALVLKTKQDSLSIAQAENDKIKLENEKIQALNLYNEQQIALLDNEKKLQQLQIEKDSIDYAIKKAETDRKQEELLVLNTENDIQELQLKKQKQTKNFFIGGLILITALSFFVYRNYHTRQRLKLLTFRNKIASDLHDDIGSTLSSISIFSQIAQQQSQETIPMLETIGESSRKMLDAMADIVWTINPENDQFEKIISRMKSFAYELLGAKKIDFEFIADDEVSKINIPMEVRKNLYLIFKEATNNMVKYANADKAMFSIKNENKNLTLLIQDNGKGFDVRQSTEGNGLKNMKKRATAIGADLLIDSHPGNGTIIQLMIAV